MFKKSIIFIFIFLLFTGTAYVTQVTGYDVTAQYNGIIGKTVEGKTVYTALFIGTPIVSPILEIMEIPSETITVTEPTTEIIEIITEREVEPTTIEIYVEIDVTIEMETTPQPYVEPTTEIITEGQNYDVEPIFERTDEISTANIESSAWFTAFIAILAFCAALIIAIVFLFVKKKIKLI